MPVGADVGPLTCWELFAAWEDGNRGGGGGGSGKRGWGRGEMAGVGGGVSWETGIGPRGGRDGLFVCSTWICPSGSQ